MVFLLNEERKGRIYTYQLEGLVHLDLLEDLNSNSRVEQGDLCIVGTPYTSDYGETKFLLFMNNLNLGNFEKSNLVSLVSKKQDLREEIDAIKVHQLATIVTGKNVLGHLNDVLSQNQDLDLLGSYFVGTDKSKVIGYSIDLSRR